MVNHLELKSKNYYKPRAMKKLSEKLNDKQMQCYSKAMNKLNDAYLILCNINDPLPSVNGQDKVIKIIQDTKDKINALINRK